MEAEKLFEELSSQIKDRGYYLNSDREFTNSLLKGLLVNQERYGYRACPCRLASGVKARDLDIICPCDYRDQDLNDHGACFCGLYVSREIAQGEKKLQPVPERRPGFTQRSQMEAKSPSSENKPGNGETYPLWRCRVCGYLCARSEPPEKCPICQVGKERFEEMEIDLKLKPR